MTRRLSYEDAVAYLFGLQKYGIKFGLSKTSNLLKAFGNPHLHQKYIHIAGTNGKGSVAAMLESIWMNSGLKVALYSSPHLVRFTERFRINGKEIPPGQVADLVKDLKRVIDQTQPPTFFEVTTAMALIYFAREKPDISIMEVGMGGRLDATNVIRPMASVITNISLDHQSFLGPRLTDIAGEKAGIIKPGIDLVTAATQPQVIKVFSDTCKRRKAPFWRVGREIRYRRNGAQLNYYGMGRIERDLDLGLVGKHQLRNAALALAVIELIERRGFTVSSDHIREGLNKTRWPGRMQVVSKKPRIILDGAHNPDAMRNLVNSMRDAFQWKHLILVLGIMGDKDIPKIIKRIVPIADYVIYTRPEYYRAAEPQVLMKEAAPLRKKGEIIPTIPEALRKAKGRSEPGDVILVTGSLFTVGEAMACLEPEAVQPDKLR
jgi:dihydrofolate synthase/folylpolyglutamate synthase